MFFGLTHEQLFSHARSAAKILGTVAVMFGVSDTGIIDSTADNIITILGAVATIWGLWSSHTVHTVNA